MKLFQTLSALILVAGLAAQAQTPAAPARTKEAAVRELLKVSGSGKLGLQVMDQMIPQLKQMAPGTSDKFWEKFRASVNVDELVDLMVPVYEKHLSQEEIEQIIAFYKTPAGQKLVTSLPAMMSESMQIGQAWGQKLALRAMEEIKAQESESPAQAPEKKKKKGL